MYKLDLLCSRDVLKPILNHVFVTKDWCLATDAVVMGRVPTHRIFRKDFIEGLPDGGVLIHWEDWKKLKGKVMCFWKSKEVIGINYFKKPKNELIEAVMPSRFTKPFPVMDNILAKCQPTQRWVTSFSPAKMKDVCDALCIEWPLVSFHEADLGTDIDYVMTVDHATEVGISGLLMPVKIENR